MTVMLRILHMSDTHFGTHRVPVMQALHQAVRGIAPDIIVLSGDITQRARKAQFAQARVFCDGLGVPVLAVPGNHDLPLFNLYARVFSPYRNYQRFFGPREWVHRQGGVMLVGFDATHPRRHKHGALDPAAVDRRLSVLRAEMSAGDALVAVVHQPLMVAWPEDMPQRLKAADDIAQVFLRYGVAAVLGGHVHVPLLAQSPMARDGRSFLYSGAGTAVSWRTRPQAPNSFNVLTIAGGVATGVIYHYDDESQIFLPA